MTGAGRGQPSFTAEMVAVVFQVWGLWKERSKEWSFLKAPLLTWRVGVGKTAVQRGLALGPPVGLNLAVTY